MRVVDSLDARVVFVPFFPSWGPVATILSIRAWQKKKEKKNQGDRWRKFVDSEGEETF